MASTGLMKIEVSELSFVGFMAASWLLSGAVAEDSNVCLFSFISITC